MGEIILLIKKGSLNLYFVPYNSSTLVSALVPSCPASLFNGRDPVSALNQCSCLQSLLRARAQLDLADWGAKKCGSKAVCAELTEAKWGQVKRFSMRSNRGRTEGVCPHGP